MNSLDTKQEILLNIRGKLRKGDILAIARKQGFTQEYVGKVLNPGNKYFNESIVAEAIEIISIREQGIKKLLKKVVAA